MVADASAGAALSPSPAALPRAGGVFPGLRRRFCRLGGGSDAGRQAAGDQAHARGCRRGQGPRPRGQQRASFGGELGQVAGGSDPVRLGVGQACFDHVGPRGPGLVGPGREGLAEAVHRGPVAPAEAVEHAPHRFAGKRAAVAVDRGRRRDAGATLRTRTRASPRRAHTPKTFRTLRGGTGRNLPRLAPPIGPTTRTVQCRDRPRCRGTWALNHRSAPITFCRSAPGREPIGRHAGSCPSAWCQSTARTTEPRAPGSRAPFVTSARRGWRRL